MITFAMVEEETIIVGIETILNEKMGPYLLDKCVSLRWGRFPTETSFPQWVGWQS